jgi:hypothetical protein
MHTINLNRKLIKITHFYSDGTYEDQPLPFQQETITAVGRVYSGNTGPFTIKYREINTKIDSQDC